MSVGEWLTRRILRSFSDLGEEAAAMPFERSLEHPASGENPVLDPWGLPSSTAARRDTEDMLSRVSRTETQSSDAYRRIEEHLRTVARRLDTAERSQSENSRAMNKTATEINIATREQAQAFDQLGGHVMGIGDRLGRLEHSAAQDGLKDAVKALHHGLSRLADQITQTANQSAQQVSSISGNMEHLAGRLGKVRDELEVTERHLETRIATTGEESRNRFAAFEAETTRTLDMRLGAVERAAHTTTTALDQRLTAMEEAARINSHALDQRLAASDEASRLSTHVLDQRLASTEEAGRASANAFDQRLAFLQEASQSATGALHQRLAEIEESSQSATSTLDQRLAEMQEVSLLATRALDQRLVAMQEAVRSTTGTLDQRLAAMEETSHASSGALSQRLAAMEEASQSATHALDHRLAAMEKASYSNINALDQRLAAMEAATHSATRALDQRLVAVENTSHSSINALDGRLVAVEVASHSITTSLDERLAALEEASHSTTNSLDQRLAALEEASHATADAIDRALDQLEAQASNRVGDQAEQQKRHAETEDVIARLAESFERLDARSADPAMERRLDSIERALGSLVSRLETHNPAAGLEDSMSVLVRRVESVEKNHDELLDELRANLAGGAKPVIAEPEPSFDPSIFAQKEFTPAHFAEDQIELEAPPFADPGLPGEDLPTHDHDLAADDLALHEPHEEPKPPYEDDPFAADPFVADSFVAEPFPDDTFVDDASSPGDFTPPSEEPAAPSADDNFLAAARRSARAAAEAEANKTGRIGFAWGADKTKSEADERPRSLVPILIIAVLILAVAGGVLLNQRLKSRQAIVPTPVPQTVQKAAPVPQAQPTPSQGLDMPPGQQAPASATPEGANTPATPVPAPQPPQAVQNKGPVPTLDRVTQLANGGNATAQTIIGLKELDGDGVPANPADAAKWLERAAQQGQPVAQYRLGAIYERGQGVGADPATATHWYQLAANLGNRKAMHNLAVAYASGAAGKKDMAEAARWFAKAAALGLADSQFNLAVLYERGDGVPQSLLDAYKWYAIAAAQGDAESKSRLSVLVPQLSDDDRNTAQKSAATFRAAALNRAANIPPEMADLSGN